MRGGQRKETGMIKRWGRTGHMELTEEKGQRREREMQRKESCLVRSQGHGFA